MALAPYLQAFQFLREGALTNLWGVGCPFYCTAPSLGTLVSFLLLGLIFGAVIGAWACHIFYTSGLVPAEQVPVPSPELRLRMHQRRQRLGGYVHE